MADTRFKVDKGLWVTKETGSTSNSTIETDFNVTGNVNITGNLLHITGDFSVGGNIVYSNTQIAGDLVPTTPGANLGNTTNRFTGWYTNTSMSGYLYPTANDVLLGSPTLRWNTYTTNVNSSGTLTVTGNSSFGSALSIDTTNKRVGVNSAVTTSALTVVGDSTFTGNVTISAALSSGNTSVTSVTFGVGAMYSNTKTATYTQGTPTVVDSFPTSLGNSAKIHIMAANNTTYHTEEILLIHNGVSVFATKYAGVYNTSMGSFDANVNGSNIEISFNTALTGPYTVKTIRQQML